jgi:hypothetical protein
MQLALPLPPSAASKRGFIGSSRFSLMVQVRSGHVIGGSIAEAACAAARHEIRRRGHTLADVACATHFPGTPRLPVGRSGTVTTEMAVRLAWSAAQRAGMAVIRHRTLYDLGQDAYQRLFPPHGAPQIRIALSWRKPPG